ncbi:MAG TPA: hypothetical protein VHO02_00735, partial [Fibrobacteria bacterium]|nr:hypothetical protein [Fibrobacteria bacterium]
MPPAIEDVPASVHPLAMFRNQVAFVLMALYVFMLPLGNLARFSEEESAFGFTTVLLPLILLLMLPSTILPLVRSKVFVILALLIGWMIVASMFAMEAGVAARDSASLVLYLLFAASVRYSVHKPWRMVLLIAVYCLGAFVSSFLTLIDFAGIVDVPRVNEVTASTYTAGIGNVLQVSGAFPRRSAMAEYYGPIIAMSALMALSSMRLPLLVRLMFVATAIASAISLALTHNRAGVMAAGIIVVAIVVVASTSIGKLLKAMAVIAVVAVTVSVVITQAFPEVWAAYKVLLGIEDTAYGGAVKESDELRVQLFWHAVHSLARNPVGNGYGLLTGLTWDEGWSEFDSHSNLTQVIWAGGLVGIGCLAALGWHIGRRSWRLLRRAKVDDPWRPVGIVLLGGVGAVVLVGLTHTTISNG